MPEGVNNAYKTNRGVLYLNRIKLMVVEDNTELRRMIADYFSVKDDIEVVGAAANGVEALVQLEDTNPDVMLLDMIMPKMDGFEMLTRMQQMETAQNPEVIALTALCRDDFISRAIELGARYYMVKPFDFELLYQRVTEVASKRREASAQGAPTPNVRSGRTLEERTATLFLTVGIPAHIKGYQYLREAVRLIIEKPDMINRITKELYPTIARRFATSSSKVERAIRHAIEVAWGRGRIDVLDQVFGPNVCSLESKPTNGEFIALVADKLQMDTRTAS